MRNRKRMGGFTLFDIMITLTIGAIVTTIGVPSFQAVMNSQRMSGSTNELVMSLNLAKSEAIKRVQYVTVCVSSNGATCNGTANQWSNGWIVFANTSNASLGAVDAGDEIIRIFPPLSAGTTLVASGTVGNFLSIRPNGTIGTAAANMTGTLTLCDHRGADFARGVIVDSSGQWNVSHDETHVGESFTCP